MARTPSFLWASSHGEHGAGIVAFCVLCNVLLMFAGFGAFSFSAANNSLPEKAQSWLDLITADGWPYYKFLHMMPPGAPNKSFVQAMHIGLARMFFSVPGSDEVLHASNGRGPSGTVRTTICMFSSPLSGSHLGDKLLSFGFGLETVQMREIVMDVELGRTRPRDPFEWYRKEPMESSTVQVLFFDITDRCSRAAGIYALHQLRKEPGFDEEAAECASAYAAVDRIRSSTFYPIDSEPPLDVRAVAAGGDGTITWLIEELYTVAEPPITVPVGGIPLGTGNDLSRQLNTPAGEGRCQGAGFPNALASGSVLAEPKGIMEVMAKFSLAPSVVFDIWSTAVDTQPGGDLREVRRGKLGTVDARCKRRVGGRCERMEQTMANYASVGFESIIGLEFEKWRGMKRDNTLIRNKIKYAELGAMYTAGQTTSPDFPFLKNQPLNEFVDRVHDNVVNERNSSSYGCDPRESTIMGAYKSLMFMNIECVVGGQRKWQLNLPVQPLVNDGHLELLSFTSPLTLSHVASDKCEVGQYRSPTMTFKPDTNMGFQIDGEFYAGLGISTLNITFKEQVRVLQLGTGSMGFHGRATKDKMGSPTIRFS